MAQISLRGYNREIESLIDRGQIDEAIAHCKHILKKFPKHIGTYRLLGKCYLETQRYIEATDILQRVLTVFPDDFISQIGMSIIREDEGNLDGAIWHMERAFEVQPSNSAVQGEIRRLFNAKEGVEPPKVRLTHGALIRMYAKSELHQQAIAEAKTALAEDPERVDLEVILAKMYYLIGQKTEAAEVCDRILKNLEYCYDANKIMSEVMIESNKAEEAKTYQQKIAAVEPYAAFITTEIPLSEDVDEKMVMVEKLEWQASEYESQRRTKILGVDTQELVNFAQEPEENFNTVRSFDTSTADQTVAIPKSSVPLADYAGPENKTETVQPPEVAAELENKDVEKSSLEEKTLPIEALTESEEETTPEIQGIPSLSELSDRAQEEISEPQSSESEALPDWMKTAGWSVSDGTIPETPIPYEEVESGENGPIQPAEIPDWLQSLAPAESEESAPTPEDQEKIELLNKILPPEESETIDKDQLTEQISSTSVNEDLQVPTQEAEGMGASLNETTPAIPETMGDSSPQPSMVHEDLPDWLKNTAQPIEQQLPINDEEPARDEGLPDWLRSPEQPISEEFAPDSVEEKIPSEDSYFTIPASQETPEIEETTLPASPEMTNEFQTWASENEPDTQGQIEPGISSPEPVSTEPQNIEPEVKPEWLQDEQVPVSDVSQALPDSSSLPEWLREEPASQQSSINEKILESSEVSGTPEWMKSIDENIPSMNFETPSQTTDLVENQSTKPPESELKPANPDIPEPNQAVPEWLKEISNTSEISDLDDEILPTWAKSSPELAGSVDTNEAVQPQENNQNPSTPLAAEISPNQINIEDAAVEPVAAPAELNKEEDREEISSTTETPSVNPIDSWLENLNKEEVEKPVPSTMQEGTTSFNDFLQNPQTVPSEVIQQETSLQQESQVSENSSEPPLVSDETLVSKPYVDSASIGEDHPAPEIEIAASELVDSKETSSEAEPADFNPVEKVQNESDEPVAQPQENGLDHDHIEEPLLSAPEMIDDSISGGSDIDLESWLNSLEEVTDTLPPPEQSGPDNAVVIEQKPEELELPATPQSAANVQPESDVPISQDNVGDLQPGSPEVSETILQPESDVPISQDNVGDLQPVSPEVPETILQPEQISSNVEPEADWLNELNIESPKESDLSKDIPEPLNELPDDTQIGKKVPAPGPLSDKTEPSLTYEDILNHANDALSQGNIPDALKKYSILIKSGEKIEETIRNLRSAVYKHPTDVSIWQTLGDGYAKNNLLQEALDAYTKAEELLK